MDIVIPIQTMVISLAEIDDQEKILFQIQLGIKHKTNVTNKFRAR